MEKLELQEVQANDLADNIIIARDLMKKFGKEFAVRDVTFDVPRGKIFGFIGPSGSGKTTTIRMLTGYYEPSGGEVKVFGIAPAKFTQKMREKIGYLPQLFVLYPNLSIWENLNFVASIYGLGLFGKRAKQLEQVLDLVELSEHRNKLARNISGGMQRRLNLAATLIHDPELIFLDEPTAGVDPVLRHKFWSHFRELSDAGRTLFITTQYVGEAIYCDLVGVINEGTLLQVDTPEGLRRRAFGGDILELHCSEPLDLEHALLLSALPFVKGDITRAGDNQVRVTVDEANTGIPRLLNWCRENDVLIKSVEEFLPPFDDVFVELVRQKD
ncbi:MAG: ABC transporter ATP-binding protein [Anaerolineales bacterium]|jgi:ABC-2 type transport system ATP-binding protein